jgi:hypothetical protein
MPNSSAKAAQQREPHTAFAPEPVTKDRPSDPATVHGRRLRHWRERLLSRLLELLEPRSREI